MYSGIQLTKKIYNKENRGKKVTQAKGIIKNKAVL